MKSRLDNNTLDMALCEMTKQRDDLLAALKDLVPLAEQAMREANQDGANYSIDIELEDAKSAIAKAECLHK